MKQYIDQARNILKERMERMIAEVSDVKGEYNNAVMFDKIVEDAVFIADESQKGNIAFFRTGREITDISTLMPIGAFAYYSFGSDIYAVSPFDTYSRSDIFYCKEDGKYYELYFNEALKSDDLKPANVELPIVGFAWSLRADTRWKQNTAFERHINEAIVAYTMSAWLSDKLPERVQFYDTLFTASAEMAVKNIFKKQAPTYEK